MAHRVQEVVILKVPGPETGKGNPLDVTIKRDPIIRKRQVEGGNSGEKNELCQQRTNEKNPKEKKKRKMSKITWAAYN